MTATATVALLLPLVSAAPAATAGPPRPGSLQDAFADAAREYQVPQSVLLGVSYLQSRWDGHSGAPSVAGGYGPMHLTDVRTAIASAPHHSEGAEDARGDDSRPRRTAGERHGTAAAPDKVPASRRTLEKAADLTGIEAGELRGDDVANIRGGAALLAASQRELGLPLSSDPADWYGAVAGYAGADDSATATAFADDVYSVIREGERRTTGSGQVVSLPASPGVTPRAAQVKKLGLRTADAGASECPRSVPCEWIPAPYQELPGDDYGNHDKGDRPRSQKIEYIVVHDTEATWDTTLKLVQDPTYVSWQYSLRSSDGHVAQHVPLKDVAWHAGNWYVNAKSIGLEHEGFLVAPDAWYTEAMYRASSRLVRYLAAKYDIPLDRQHILGHDNVPGPTAVNIPAMHTDPGPYWDWDHYFRLLGAPLHANAGRTGGLVTIRPEYAEHQPAYRDCEKYGDPCAPHGSGAVRLHTEPSGDSPLVTDIGLRPDGSPATTGVNDVGARASTGQQFAVAERKGDWTAIWYLGQKAWFHNPAAKPTALNNKGLVITPRSGAESVPVYGRAYPEKSAYPEGVRVQSVTPLPYRLEAGQKYVLGGATRGEYYWAVTYDSTNHRVVRGKDVYYEIQFGHRVAYVKADDVKVRSSRG
ncbi:N-acetylmuramoyl-L-alanine amidase [Streptomyces meridianus]|uniref:N-acetylmuramoyl-L-alanine amidase n=1 Tax=Streptomyces meridianus TaxID=2938945 RepID=A0ABT0X9M5_9ACTN|nr:N-acetylmuramoyl-L-alanine amidase [Streptomyces meridianus]MCM2579237.1 N-acetylmuramoyl-L-alanine amidase [Streptomyces meridianus]